MEKYKRKKCLHFIGNALKSKLKFDGVNYQSIAGLSPDMLTSRSLYVFRGPDPMQDLTNTERVAGMHVHIVAFLVDETGDIEAQKADLQDEVEEVIYEDITLGNNCTQAKVVHSDPSAFSLAPLGFDGPVEPPLGAFRMDIEVTIDYGAFT
jgi:hypothetical protein